MTRTFTHTLKDGTLVDVTAEYVPGSPGAREYRGGPLIDPDEPEFWEVQEVTDLAGEPIDLTTEEWEEITQAAQAQCER